MKKNYLAIIFIVLFVVFLIATINLVRKYNKGENNMSNTVVLETTKGVIEIELDTVNAPITTSNFIAYVNAGHYNGLVFHRVIKGFMVQGGGFTPDGNQKSTQAPIILESNNGLKNKVGTVAMARTNAPNSATSQFFINTVDNDFLDYTPSNPGYAVFGKVTKGMHIVFEIENVKTTTKKGNGDWPVEDIIITKAYMR